MESILSIFNFYTSVTYHTQLYDFVERLCKTIFYIPEHSSPIHALMFAFIRFDLLVALSKTRTLNTYFSSIVRAFRPLPIKTNQSRFMKKTEVCFFSFILVIVLYYLLYYNYYIYISLSVYMYPYNHIHAYHHAP